MTILRQTSLVQSYQACQEMMRQDSESLHQAFSLLPADRFRAVAAIYAFRHYVHSLIVDANLAEADALAQFDALEQAIEAMYQPEMALPEAVASLVWFPAFVETVQHYQVEKAALIEQLHGQKVNIGFTELETTDQLIEYCRHVGGSVGMMLWPILGRDDLLAEADQTPYLQVCYDIATGMQLTSVLRDVGEDAVQYKRVYLPATVLKAHGLSKYCILALSQQRADAAHLPFGFKQVWQSVAEQGEEFYNVVDSHLVDFHPSCRLAVLAVSLLYRAIEDEIKQADFDCISQRHDTSRWQRMAVVNRAKKLVAQIS